MLFQKSEATGVSKKPRSKLVLRMVAGTAAAPKTVRHDVLAPGRTAAIIDLLARAARTSRVPARAGEVAEWLKAAVC